MWLVAVSSSEGGLCVCHFVSLSVRKVWPVCKSILVKGEWPLCLTVPIKKVWPFLLVSPSELGAATVLVIYSEVDTIKIKQFVKY